MTFDEILVNFKTKETESPENIAPLVENRELIDAMISWKAVAITRNTNIGSCPHTNENEQWDWLWQNVKFDLAAFGSLSGVRYQDASNLLIRLKGLRLIYPDATINGIARQYLQGIIIKMITKKSDQIPKKK